MLTREMLFSPQRLVQAASTIEGWSLINKHQIEPTHGEYGIPMLDIAVEEAEDWTDRYEGTGCGFGSSDMSYAIQGYLDHLIGATGQREALKTVFDPVLMVVSKDYKTMIERAKEQAGDKKEDYLPIYQKMEEKKWEQIRARS
jgi:hypothetical protein